MTQLGKKNQCRKIKRLRTSVSKILKEFQIKEIDANSLTTGGDYLTKIWKQIFSVPIGIAIISEDLPSGTIGNIFYELGLMDSYGKETLVLKTKDCVIPSDLTRTEYIRAEGHYVRKLRSFINNVLERVDYYEVVADENRRSRSCPSY